MATQVDDIQLIKLVQDHPILYRRTRKPGSGPLKDDIWRKLSEQLNCSERYCMTRWKSLRDRFRREYKKALENPEEVVNWHKFEHLFFLKDRYKNGSTYFDIKYEPKKSQRGRKCKPPNITDTYIEPTPITQTEESYNADADPEEELKNQRLIKLVERYPVLYDHIQIQNTKNLPLKNDAWRQISEAMGDSEEWCYKRWKTLRDRFGREYRNQQLYPETHIMWVYFDDMKFLREHFRRGKPLPVEEILKKKKSKTKKKTKKKTNKADDDPWGDDFPFMEVKDDYQEMHQQESIDIEDMKLSASMSEGLNDDDFNIENNLQTTTKTTPACTSQESNLNNKDTSTAIATEQTAEEKLSALISGIQQILKQTQDCLKSVQKQNEQHKQELQTQISCSSFNSNVSVLQRIHILLDGLSETHRSLAERRIMQFLCECQIKTLNNEDIEDAPYTHFF